MRSSWFEVAILRCAAGALVHGQSRPLPSVLGTFLARTSRLPFFFPSILLLHSQIRTSQQMKEAIRGSSCAQPVYSSSRSHLT